MKKIDYIKEAEDEINKIKRTERYYNYKHNLPNIDGDIIVSHSLYDDIRENAVRKMNIQEKVIKELNQTKQHKWKLDKVRTIAKPCKKKT